MAQSLAKIYIHLIFSTKNRYPSLIAEWREELHAYLVGILKKYGESSSNVIGGTADHVHILFCLSKNKSLSEIIHMLKGQSSRWIKQKGAHLFAWQGGYAAFSVSESVLDATKVYIFRQEEHHRKISYMEEVSSFCKLYKIEKYDETYFNKD